MLPQMIDPRQDERVADVSRRASLQRNFYLPYGKRAMDVLFSSLGLILLLPVFAFVASCIKLNSRGPVFFRQVRIGQNGRPFRIVKFRSMVVDAPKTGLGITVSGDRRITPAGKILRCYKLDELPQLWNVLWGELSLVGPRPELPTYVALYTHDQRRVLSVRPGITDPASLAYRNEEKILAGQAEPDQFYVGQILPDKLAQNIDYLRQVSFRNDLRIILRTIASSLFISETTQD
jgi:lipopolysaccharide/colanic/teichoic acid biosynthesis glycosyltransferase